MLSKTPEEYILSEKEAYKTREVTLADGYRWNMYEHIRRSFLYKHSKFWKGADDGSRPFNNIIKPILNVQYRSEGFDVKDIVPFVDDAENYHKSFLVKKYHPKWARDNNIDTFIDETVEGYVDYGLALSKNIGGVRPENVPLQRIAFCDQTDILSGAICELHSYSQDQLLEMRGKWSEEAIEELLIMCNAEREFVHASNKTKTPSAYIDVFELHGSLPYNWLEDTYEYGESDYYLQQMRVVAYYTNRDGKKCGITLFKGEEKKPIYKALKRDPIYGRACGFGGVEELFEPQLWTNYSEIQVKEMLDTASKIIAKTTSQKWGGKTRLTDLENGEILDIGQEQLEQLILQPINKQHFDNNEQKWAQNARNLGSADEALLGEAPKSGTPFALQNLVTQEGKGIHTYRRGKIATYVGEIYRDWTLGFLVKDMNSGKKFLEELTLSELEEVSKNIITKAVNADIKKQMILHGKIPTPEAIEMLKKTKRMAFMKAGSKRFMELLKDELKDIPVDVHVNIAGKQADLAERTEKLTNIFRAVIPNPQILQIPAFGRLFNEIVEDAGLSPLDFVDFTAVPEQPQTPQPQPQQSSPVAPISPQPQMV